MVTSGGTVGVDRLQVICIRRLLLGLLECAEVPHNDVHDYPANTSALSFGNQGQGAVDVGLDVAGDSILRVYWSSRSLLIHLDAA